MMIILKSLTLSNFKGIKSLRIDFSEDITNIYGANNSGKTTVMDAFFWLLFGKDADGNDTTNFHVKTLDSDFRFIPKLEHEVEGILLIDGEETVLRRTLKQSWVKPNGETEQIYKGDRTEYSIDGVPFKEGDYKQRISEIIDTETFRQITCPGYFPSLHWQKQREALIKLSPSITDELVISSRPEFAEITSILAKYTIDDFIKKSGSEIAKIQKQLNEIPARISEVRNSIPLPVNAEQLKTQKAETETRLAELDNRLTDNTSAFDEYTKKQAVIFRLESKINEIQNDAINSFKDLIRGKENQLLDAERSLITVLEEKKSRERFISSQEEILVNLNNRLTSLRQEAIENNKKEFELDENALVCPTCRRELDDVEGKIDELRASFQRNKAAAYAALKEKGERIKREIAKTEDALEHENKALELDISIIQSTEAEIDELQTSINTTKQQDITKNPDYMQTLEMIRKCKAALVAPDAQADVDEIKAAKAEATAELDNIKEQLASESIAKKMHERIEELLAEEKMLSTKKAKIERVISLCENFTKAKMQQLEETVNSMFKLARFKLFETQKNGGESPACIILYNGVPYDKDLNMAAQINVGLDIINTLGKFYDITAPVFIDNRESVTEIAKCESQIVNLIVSADDRVLRVEWD